MKINKPKMIYDDNYDDDDSIISYEANDGKAMINDEEVPLQNALNNVLRLMVKKMMVLKPITMTLLLMV